ncbi:uncharacterized protein LOC124159048 isoform X2 [Ischnura elegans]|uniref:uncharacterized protein LOC124159048 isoform X2 n=1 Tax=Ischnura elegans TaxID=197161 RepID=UPI001ED87FBF|nr:uncharacterized protein LOC124159048 isoform X2 [Ischnura elegans]
MCRKGLGECRGRFSIRLAPSAAFLLLFATVWQAPHVTTAEEIYREDPLALLSGTLRTFQRAGCEGELMTLRCPAGTSISVELAQYGRPPPPTQIFSSDSAPYRAPPVCPGVVSPDISCSWPAEMQYTLLQMVVEACQNKPQCKFHAAPKPGELFVDPCPRAAKFVEVAYKCRPYEFRSKVACQDETATIRCGARTNLAIYSATFGRSQMDSYNCPQPAGVPEEECLTSFTTELVMQICHGKKECSLTAAIENFGYPCSPNTRMYLKIVYTCVSGRVLKKRFFSETDQDEEDNFDENEMHEIYDDTGAFLKESAALPPPHPKAVMREDMQEKDEAGRDAAFRKQAEDDDIAKKSRRAQEELEMNMFKLNTADLGATDEVLSKHHDKTGNHDRIYWYIGAGIGAGMLALVMGVVFRVLIAKRQKNIAANDTLKTPYSSGSHSHQSPDNLFPDTESEIEAEIDLALASSTLNPQYNRHNVSCLRNPHLDTKGGKDADDDTNPKSLSRSCNNHYYYT